MKQSHLFPLTWAFQFEWYLFSFFIVFPCVAHSIIFFVPFIHFQIFILPNHWPKGKKGCHFLNGPACKWSVIYSLLNKYTKFYLKNWRRTRFKVSTAAWDSILEWRWRKLKWTELKFFAFYREMKNLIVIQYLHPINIRSICSINENKRRRTDERDENDCIICLLSYSFHRLK